jgi:hypothetical protein
MQMRIPLKAFFLTLAAAQLLTAGCHGKPTDGSASSASLPVWKPDAKLLEELAPGTTVEDYQVRPPKEYSINPPGETAPGQVKAFYWVGKPREDKTAPFFLIGLVPSPAAEVRERTLEKELDELLEGFKRRLGNWTQTAPERGQVNGLTFVRTHWSAIDREKQGRMHGFMYLAKDGSTVIHISTKDVEPHHEQALKLAETAVLTFKKK